MIRNAETQFQNVLLPPDRLAEASVAPNFWSRPDIPFHMPTTTARFSADAFVNHGRWLVQCPDCAGAQYAAPQDPRFFCVGCANGWAGGGWLTVVWPKERAAIEVALNQRPMEKNRNWTPGESVADLHRENDNYGVGE